MLVIVKSDSAVSKSPSIAKPSEAAAMASGAVHVGPGFRFAPPFVESHKCVPPLGVVTFIGVSRTSPSKRVSDLPSMRRWTTALAITEGALDVDDLEVEEVLELEVVGVGVGVGVGFEVDEEEVVNGLTTAPGAQAAS